MKFYRLTEEEVKLLIEVLEAYRDNLEDLYLDLKISEEDYKKHKKIIEHLLKKLKG